MCCWKRKKCKFLEYKCFFSPTEKNVLPNLLRGGGGECCTLIIILSQRRKSSLALESELNGNSFVKDVDSHFFIFKSCLVMVVRYYVVVQFKKLHLELLKPLSHTQYKRNFKHNMNLCLKLSENSPCDWCIVRETLFVTFPTTDGKSFSASRNRPIKSAEREQDGC